MEFHSISNPTIVFGGGDYKEKGGPEIPEWVVQKTRGPKCVTTNDDSVGNRSRHG